MTIRKYMMPGAKMPVFNNDDGTGGGYDDGQQPQAQQPDRMGALENRLEKLAGQLGNVLQRDQVRDQQTQRQNELSGVEGLVNDAKVRVATAETKLADAYEAGDSAAIARATSELGAATAEHTAARMQFQSVKQRLEQQPQQQQTQQQRLDDSNLRQWRDRNKDWYGVDPEMTRHAMQADQEVRGERLLEVGSEAYFKAIDARVRAKFPDRFPAPSNFSVPRGGNMAQNGNNQPQQRISASVADGYRRMGIDVDNPDVAKAMVAARDTAVKKGFLPAQPPSDGRVITR